MSRLISFEEIPRHMTWLTDNPFILKYHRPPTSSLITCITSSITKCNTETINILTHLIPTLLAMYTLCYHLLYNVTFSLFHHEFPWDHVPVMDRCVISSLLLGFISCFGLSTLFHAFSCHVDYGGHFLKADFFGILIAGSCAGVSMNYFILYHHQLIFATNSIINIFTTFIFLFLTSVEPFSNTKAKKIKTLLFTLYAVIAFFPSILYLLFLTNIMEHNYLTFIISIFFLYGGGFFYNLKIPESIWPGYFDLCGHSHNIMHVGAALSALFFYEFILQIAQSAYVHYE